MTRRRARFSGDCADQQVANTEVLAALGGFHGPLIHQLPRFVRGVRDRKRRQRPLQRTSIGGPHAPQQFRPDGRDEKVLVRVEQIRERFRVSCRSVWPRPKDGHPYRSVGDDHARRLRGRPGRRRLSARSTSS
ncbi:MAG TPA: hypothetical protein VFO19_01310 [Vicinamibacterales bacterium]|nr:hypothetical protein [Vicinamibacterales bacterium]